MGSLGFGHYTSVVKNPKDGRWYHYDDSSVTPTPEEKLKKDKAYILFYQRKDVKDKQIADIFPSLKNFFPGKPV